MTVGDPAVADVAVACSEEELIGALQGGNHQLVFEQPGGRLKHGTGIGSQSMEPQHKRRLGIHSMAFEQKVVTVQPLGKNVRS